MRNISQRGSQGFTFVEMIITIVIATMAILFSYHGIQKISQSSTSVRIEDMINAALISIKSQLYTEAGSNFDNMTADDRPMPTAYPKLNCTADISEVDIHRARFVTLTFTYKDGFSTVTATRQFAIAQSKAKQYGGVGTFCANAVGTDAPIAGVRFSADAQDLPLTDTYTSDASGCVVMLGVRLGLSTNLYVDGEGARHYFSSNNSFTKTFVLPNVVGRLDLSGSPYMLDPPAKVVGTVTDPLNSNDPVANGKLWLRGNNTVVGSGMSSYETITNGSGEFTFSGVLPGAQYHLYFVGSDVTNKLGDYLAVATPGDRWDQSPPPGRFALTSGQEKTINFKTTLRGSLQGNLIAIGAEANKFVVRSITQPNLNLTINPDASPLNRTIGYYGADLTQSYYTTGSKFHLMDTGTTAPARFTVPTPSGAYSILRFNPYIVHQNHGDKPFNAQYSKVFVRPPTPAPAPYVPALFYATGVAPYEPANTQLVIINTDGNPMMRPDPNSGNVTSAFLTKIYPKITNTKDIQLLHREAMANVKGVIKDYLGNTLNPGVLGIDRMVVRVKDGSLTVAVRYSDSGPNSTASYRANQGNDVTFNGIDYVFDMSQYSGGTYTKNIFPTIGTNPLTLEFVGYFDTANESKAFGARVIGYTKKKLWENDAWVVRYVETDDINGLSINVEAESTHTGGRWTSSAATIISKAITFNHDAIKITNELKKEVAVTDLKPGETRENVAIWVPSIVSDRYSEYFLRIVNNLADWRFNNLNTPRFGPRYAYSSGLSRFTETIESVRLSLVRIGNAKISGSIKKADGTLIDSGRVTLRVVGGVPPGEPTSFTYDLTTAPCGNCGSGGNYVFGDPTLIKFLLTFDPNFQMDVTAPGYVDVASYPLQGWEGMDERVDFTMITLPDDDDDEPDTGF